MYNHAFRNQLLYNEDLQKAKSTSKDHAVFAINIDYTDTIKNKHFQSKMFLVEMQSNKDKIVDVGLLNSLQSKYLYCIGCLSPNALDQKAMASNIQTLSQIEALGKKKAKKEPPPPVPDNVSTSSSKLMNRLRDTSSQGKLSQNSKLKQNNIDDGLSHYSHASARNPHNVSSTHKLTKTSDKLPKVDQKYLAQSNRDDSDMESLLSKNMYTARAGKGVERQYTWNQSGLLLNRRA